MTSTHRAGGSFTTELAPAWLRDVVAPFDPVASIYADLSLEGEDARSTQWHVLSAALAEQGASRRAIAALEDRFAAAKLAPEVLALFAAEDGAVLHEQRIAGPPPAEPALFAAPASVLPLLRAEQQRPPHVIVVIDRAGADLVAAPGASSGKAARRWSVTGPDDEIEHNAPGGWASLSQSRYRNRAADSWRHNARRVAAEVGPALDEVNAQVLVVSGDGRAVQLLLDQLPHRDGLLVRRIHGSRAFDGSQRSRSQIVERELRAAADERAAELFHEFREELRPHGRAVAGARDTIAALVAGRVDTLLLGETQSGSRICFGERGTDLFADRESAVDAAAPLRCGRLADVAIRAALLSGAGVRVLPAEFAPDPDGIGALCRYAPA
jgi:hypothetical protein